MSGNTYIAPDGKSLLQETQIAALTLKAATIEEGLRNKVDATKYAGKIALLEANDTRHDADIAWLEENKLNKTIFDTKLNLLLAKDNIHDLRLATLEALKDSKLDGNEAYNNKISALDAKDVEYDTRLTALETDHAELFNDVQHLINVTLAEKVTNAALKIATDDLKAEDSRLLGLINEKASQAIADQIAAGLTAVNADMVTKVDFQEDKTALEGKNVTWEKRLNAVEQYIRAMIETYEIKKPGDTAAYEYTADFQKNWAMKEDHFTIVGRNPGGQILVELPEWSYNTFYGSIKMFLNSNTDINIPESTKVYGDVTESVPHRVTLSYDINGMFEQRHFPIAIRMDNSAGEEIKIKTLTETDYKNLPIIVGAAFTYPRTKFYLVKGFSGLNNTLNEVPAAILGSNLNASNIAWTMTGLPNNDISIDTSGKITGSPGSDFPLYTDLNSPLEVIVKSTIAGGNENKLTLSFNVVAPHTISYTLADEYARNVDIPYNLAPVVTNAVAPNDKLVFSVTNPDSTLSAEQIAAGMFTDGVYITKVADTINDRAAGTIWGNPKNVINNSYTIKAVGLNGYEATFNITLKVIDTPPSFDYKHFLPAGTTDWTNYTYTARINDVVSFLPNVAQSSGAIDGDLYPGMVKPNYTIDPALPANSNLTFDEETGKIYTPVVAPVNGVAQPQGILSAFDPVTYTITAYGPGGSSTAAFKLQSLGPVPTFSYNPISMQFVKGVVDSTGYAPVNPLGVAATSGYALYDSAGITPSTLPVGLNFNVNTGVVSAPTAPTAVASTQGFSVIATGPNGSSIPVPFYLTVKDALPDFSYSSAVKTFVRGVDAGAGAFAPTTAAGSGVINFYALFDNSGNPTVLPAGVYFNNTTGEVTGNPLFSDHGNAVTYKVKAFGPGGESAFKTFQLKINEPAPVIDYSQKYDGTAATVQHFTEGVEITPISPITKVNDINTWTISGQPDGITIDAATGVISGTPSARNSAAVDVTVTATGDGGSDSVDFKMKVDYKTPKFAYPAGVQTVYVNEDVTIAITGVTEGLGGGTITWESTPALPAGLSIGASGTITGSTIVLGGPKTCRIKATNADNKYGYADVVINVDTQVAGSDPMTVLIGDADYDVRYFESDTSNTDKVFVKKVSADDLANASLVYRNASNDFVEIAKHNLVSGDFVEFSIDRAAQKTANTDLKLFVIPDFDVSSTDADVVATIQYNVPALWVPPAPTLATIDNVTVEKGAAFPTTTASVTNGVAVTWSLSGQPANVNIDSATGVISGTVAVDAVAQTYNVTVSATPVSGGSTVSKSFTVTVNYPTPVINPINDVTVEKGASFEPIQVIVTNGVPVTWSMTGAPANVSIDSGAGTISGTVTGNAGTYTVTVNAHSIFVPTSGMFSFNIIVTEPAAPSLPKLTVSGTRSALTLSFTPNITGSGFYSMTGDGVNWGISGASFDVTAGVPIILERNYSWTTLDPLYITIRSPFGEQLTTIELVPV